MRRREVILALAGATAVPFFAHGQQRERTGQIAVLMMYPEGDPQGQIRATVFRSELEKAGWSVGGNLKVNFHWGTGDANWVRSAIEQILQQKPDVILANGDAAVKAAQGSTKTAPVIFIASGDPVGDGLVQSLAHPGSNLTGFAVMEPSLGAKLLGMLKQVAPRVGHVGVLVNPDSTTHKRIVALLTAAAPNFAVEVLTSPAREAADIKSALIKWGEASNYGVVVPSDPSTNSNRALIIDLAARHRIPVVFALRAAVADGGLMSYGVDIPELFRRAAVYADRILKGEKPADLPVQLPTKFELVINLKTAKALGFEIPMSLIATADEVIE
jgi:putative ABC transport system substrate-binding protein